MKREVDRKARLLSTIVFFYLLLQLLFLMGSILAAPATLPISLMGDAIIISTLPLTRSGRVTLAGFVLVAWFEFSLALTIVSANPLSLQDVQLYDLFIIGELFAVSLLPIRTVFFVAIINSAFMIVDLLYLPRTAALTAVLQKELVAILVRPVSIQIIVAVVTALWVYSASKAVERANRAEMVATLEHVVAEQRATIEQEKQELEAGIQQLVQAHIDASNGQIAARIPYPSAKVLWPLVGVINSLWVRLRSSQQVEQELESLKRAIGSYNDLLQRSHSLETSLPLPRTGTDLDPLILSLKMLQGSQRSNISSSGDVSSR